MPGNWPVPFGKGPSEKDPRHGNLVGGLLHLTGGGWKRDVGHGRSESCPGETLDRGAETYRRSAPPRQPPTLLRTGNAARKFIQADGYVTWRLKRLMISKRGRNLRAGQAQTWTEEWFNGHGLHRLRGTIRYPKAA